MTEVRRRNTAAHTDAASFLARDRRRALAEGRTLPQLVTGAALFADISGFTPLTEALAAELGPQHGAEELSLSTEGSWHSLHTASRRAVGAGVLKDLVDTYVSSRLT